MHWCQNEFPSSSPSCSSASPSSSSPKSSSVDSSPKGNVGDIDFFRNRHGLRSQAHLTRQRKLRYLSDHEVGISWNNNVIKVSVMSNSTPVSGSPSSLEPSTAWFSSVVPQPLPLPERRESGVSIPGSEIAYKTIGKSTEHVDTWSAKSTTDHGRKVVQDPNVTERVPNNFRLNFPVNSGPTSGFSSTALSPRRSSYVNFCPLYLAPRGYQIFPAPEFPVLDMLTGFSSHASPEENIPISDCSPLRSLRVKIPHPNPKSLSAASSPLHHNLFPESSTTWHENNGHASLHPLPLPPGAVIPSQSAYVHQNAYKLEVSSMKNQWQKRNLIGRGTFGSVYLATNRETGALCAMKEVDMIPDDPKSAECIKQLEQEIKVLSQLKHPNIVQYYGSEIVDDHFYIYLEYVYPGSINKYIREHCESMTESVVRNFTRHILSGLAYLHSIRTIHRDIKGANLLVNVSGVVKLSDFGMAKHLTGQAADLSLRGSPYWMAPEVIQSVMQKDSSGNLALAVDIWSIGCTIIEMLNGKPPWSEVEGPAAMFNVLRETPPIPEMLSSEGKDFLRCCFRRNPAERPSASQLLDHPFLRSSHHLDVPGCTQTFSAMKLVDKIYSRRECKHSAMPISPGTQMIEGKLPSSG